jgi:hypothetical protein
MAAESITIYNCSAQMIPLQLRKPNSEFYANEQQVRIMSGKQVTLPKSHLMMEQIESLAKQRMIRILRSAAN